MTRSTKDNIVRTALRKGSGVMTVVFALSFMVNLLRLTGPVFMLLIYDRVLPSRSTETLIVLFAMMVVLLVVMGLMDYARRRLLARFGAQFQERIEDEMFSTTEKDKFFARNTKKPVVGLDELDSLRNFIHSGALLSILDFIWTPMFLLVVFVLHPLLGWIAVGGVIVLLVVTLIRSIVARGREEHARAAGKNITDLKDMMMSSRGVLRNHEMTETFNARWLEARRVSRDRAIESRDLTAWFQIIIRQLRLILQYTVLGVGAWLTLRGELTIGAMVASTFLVVRVIVPFEQVLSHLPTTGRAIGQWRRLNEQMSERGEIFHAETLNDFVPRLELSGVTARAPFGKQNTLKGITLTIPPGSLVEITGDSGAGKTALAETLLGVYPRAGGSYLCGGANIDRFSSAQARRIFGYAPQSEEFIHGTIGDNITGLSQPGDPEPLYAAARLAYVHEAIMALPDGYQTMLDSTGTLLPRGQKSRISFARAIYHNPRILILDEPDNWLRASLPRRLKPFVDGFLAKGNILIVMSRRSLALPETTMHLMLEDGRIKPHKEAANVTKLADKQAEKKRLSGVKGG